MAGAAEREARRGLARLRRALDKAARELELVETVLLETEGGDFPAEVFDQAALHLHAVEEFIDEQAERLEARILQAGGLAPEGLRGRGGARRDRE